MGLVAPPPGPACEEDGAAAGWFAEPETQGLLLPLPLPWAEPGFPACQDEEEEEEEDAAADDEGGGGGGLEPKEKPALDEPGSLEPRFPRSANGSKL